MNQIAQDGQASHTLGDDVANRISTSVQPPAPILHIRSHHLFSSFWLSSLSQYLRKADFPNYHKVKGSVPNIDSQGEYVNYSLNIK